MSSLHLFDFDGDSQAQAQERPWSARKRVVASMAAVGLLLSGGLVAARHAARNNERQAAPSATEQAMPARPTEITAPAPVPDVVAPAPASPARKRAESPIVPAPVTPSPRRPAPVAQPTPPAVMPIAPASPPV